MIKISPAKNQRSKEANQGFTYTLVLVSIVIMGIVLNVTTTLSSHVARTEKEKEHLFRGMAYRKAIESYYNVQGKRREYPKSLNDLVNDPRFANKHHLRQKYAHVLKNDRNWDLILNEHGRIIGVVSSYQALPLKQANFPPNIDGFDNKKSYSQWRFVYHTERAFPASDLNHSQNKINIQ